MKKLPLLFLWKCMQRSILLISCLTALCIYSIPLSAQIYECGFIEEESNASSSSDPIDDEDCEPNIGALTPKYLGDHDLKCIRIKFHYLNNTNDPSLAPSDLFYYDLLQKINAAFLPGKIRFTMDDNCIHRVNLEMNGYTIDQQADVLTLLNEDEFENDDNAINVYSLQEVFPPHMLVF